MTIGDLPTINDTVIVLLPDFHLTRSGTADPDLQERWGGGKEKHHVFADEHSEGNEPQGSDHYGY